MLNKSLAVYIVIAIFVAAGIFIAVSAFTQKPYSVSVSLSRSGPNEIYPFMTTQLGINVNNTGDSAISNLSLNLYVNGQIFHAYSVSLPPHKNATINASYTHTASGSYLFKAAADPGMLLNIKDRQHLQSTLNVTVNAPENPEIYKFMPNNGIDYTSSFSLYPKGIAFAGLLESDYNITFAKFFGPSYEVTSKVLGDLYSFTAIINGAYALYADKTAAYGVWLQGSMNSSYVQSILSTYRPAFQKHSFMLGNANATYVKLSNLTSMCFVTDLGWTKLLVYYNNSLNQTCANMISKTHLDNESSIMSNALKAATDFVRYENNFTYTNSTVLASTLIYGNGSISSFNLFNNSYGFFGARVIRNAVPADVNHSLICDGIIFNSSNVSICSEGRRIAADSLINTTMITPNYTFTIYSLVNNTYAVSAHSNAVKLLEYLNVSGTKLAWSPIFKNSCFLNATDVGCKLLEFNRVSSNATVNITNNLPYQIALKNIYCGLGGMGSPSQINDTLAPGSSTVLATTCHNVPIPLLSALTSYSLVLNYTHGNETVSAFGSLNVTNLYLP